MATISLTPSRGLVTLDLNLWETTGSGNPETNKSTVNYSVVIRRGPITWDTSWAYWNQSIYTTIDITGFGSKVIYIPTYNYGGVCPPGTVIDSGSFVVEHDSKGNKTINFGISFTDNANATNSQGNYYTPGNGGRIASSVALANIPRYFTSTPSLTFKDKTETQIRYNWSTSETCDEITIDGTGTKDITGLPGKSGVVTITGLVANTQYSHTGTFRKEDSQLTTDSSKQTNTTYQYPYISDVETANLIIGSKQKLTIYNPLSRSLTVKMFKYSVDGTLLYTGTTNSTSIEFTPDAATLYASIPDAREGDAVYQVLYSTIHKHNTSKDYKYKIKGTEVPDFTYAYMSDVLDTLHVNDITGLGTKIIKGHNKITGKIGRMGAKNSATGKRYVINADASPASQELQHDPSTYKTFTLNNLTSNNFTVTAYDSRELSTPATVTVDLIDYSKPRVNNLTVTRENGLGNYAIIRADGIFTHWSGWSQIKKYNTIQKVYYRYKISGGSNWSAWNDITSSLTKNANGSWSLSKTLDITFISTNKYDFEIYVIDLLESSNPLGNILSTANAFLWRDLRNKRLGINKKPEKTLDVGGEIACDALYIDGVKVLWKE